MTTLLQRLHDEFVRRHYTASTIDSYLKIVKAVRRHAGKRLDLMVAPPRVAADVSPPCDDGPGAQRSAGGRGWAP